MSELPWENKKIAEIMSSAGNEAKLSPDATGKNNKATSPIPDILANAFADMQMEEVQIEAHESASVVADDNMPQMTAPSFGDLPDLSLLGGIKSEGPKLDMQKTAFPPFMNSSGIPATLDKKESIAQDIPKMSYDNVFPSATPATHSGESSKKRSPPPLFQPFILSDGDAGAGPHLDTPISSAPRYKSAPLPFQPSQSISDKLPSPNPLPLSVPLPPDPGYNHLDPVHAVGVDPFASSPANVPGSLGNNPSIGVNPFASSPANAPGSLGDTPSIGVNPFASSPANAPGSLGNNPSIGVNPFASSPANVPGSLGDTPSIGVNPFASSPANVPGSLGDTPSIGVNPFASSPANVPGSLGDNPSIGVNPFASSPANAPGSLGNNPSIGVNPFASSPANVPGSLGNNPSIGVNPFASSPANASGAGVNPFGEPFNDADGSFVKNSSKFKGPGKQPINVDALKKNIGVLSVVARGLIKNLTKGKSLIERMEDMRVDTMLDDSNPLGKDDPSIVRSPFDNELDIPFASNSLNPFSLSLESSNEIASPSSENPFKVPGENVDGIRKVTPIENPVMGMKGISPFVETIAEDTVSSISDKRSRFMGVDPDIVEIIPVGDSVGDDVVDDAGINSDGLPGDMGAMPVAGNILGRQDVKKPVSNKSDIDAEVNDIALDQRLSTGVLSSGLKDMKKVADKRFDDLESDINDLKSNLMSTTIQFSAIHGDAGSFSSKVSDLDGAFSSFVKSTEESLSQNNMKFDNLEEKTSLIEGRVGNIESTLGVLQSDNLSIRSDLTRIEDNVSELVNSYTALLAQLHESLQENESNFSRIDDVSGKLDQIGSKISSIEKSQEGTRSTSMEFSRSVSLLVDNIGKVSSEFLEFKQQSEAKNVSMLERIDSVTEYVESELKNLGARSYKGFGQNVHLSNIVKNSGNMKLCMEWLEFLMGLVGCNNLPDILAYYEELGWITEKVRMELLHYAEGIDFYMEKPDWKLTPDDHVKSIWFIESLAGMKVDKNRMSVIERDIEKVKNGSDIYGI